MWKGMIVKMITQFSCLQLSGATKHLSAGCLAFEQLYRLVLLSLISIPPSSNKLVLHSLLSTKQQKDLANRC